MTPLLRYRAVVSLLVVVLLGQSCEANRVADPSVQGPIGVALAKSGAGPSVSGANPASAHQGAVTVDVTISGSGFDAGSRAIWQLNGVPASKITVNSTRFNSSTSLTANITVAPDADVATYDIAVVTSTGKKGIGAEMFTVTYAIAVGGLTQGQAISDGGVIAGYNGSDVVAVLSDGSNALVAQNSIVWDIDRAGRAIGGRDAAGRPVLWTSATGSPGSWTTAVMPDLGNGGSVRGIASDAIGDAILLTGNAFSPINSAKNAVVWTKTLAGWERRVNTLPSGVAGAWGQAINRRGQAVGMDGSGCCVALYWDSLGAVTPLAALSGARNAAAWAISGDGTTVVGISGTSAVMWRRTLAGGTYGAWTGAIVLENTSALCGRNGSSVAYDINSAGTVAVGSSCGVAVAWKLTGPSVERVVLQGLGPPNQSVAYGINDLEAPLATGSAKTSTGVYWWGF